MMKWVFIAAALYIAYYTLMYAWFVWKKERNILACVFIVLLAVSLMALPFCVKMH